ncbi:MAG: PAS domain S-box protein, partial [bacterium]
VIPVEKVLATGTIHELANHTLLIARDGTERPIGDSAAPLRDKDGRVLGVVLVFRDVSTSQRLEKLQRQFAAMVESSSDAIITKSLDGIITSWNASAEQMFGYSAAEAVGLPMLMLCPSDRADEEAQILARVGRGERSDHFETRRVRKDGSLIDVSIMLSPIKNAAGEITGISKIASDITERKRAEEALHRSSQMLHLVLDNIPGGVFWKDRDLIYLGCNSACARAAGLGASGEIIGKCDFDLAWKTSAEAYRADDRAVMESGIPKIDFEEALPQPDGSIACIITNKVPLRDKEGNVFGMLGTFEDITERKRDEVKLRESEEMLQSIMATARDGIILLDNDGRISYWNQAAETMLGYTAAEAAGQKLHRFLVPERYRDAGEKGFAHFSMTGSGAVFGKTLELDALKKDGTEVAVEISVSSVKVKDRWAALGIMRDITERNRTKTELENFQRQLVEASRRSGMAEIATNILHNVGNVLNSVNISTGLIVKKVKNSRASNLARVVALLEEHAQDLGAFMTADSRGKHLPAHLAQLSEHLLADQAAMGSELESLRRNVEHIKEIVAMQQNYATFGGVKEMINVVSLVEDSLRMNEDALGRYRVEVIREFDKVPPLNAEKHKILQILVNLLRNAKYACQDSKRTDPRLTVRVTNDDGLVRISVMDNGIGIPPENLTRIFNHGFPTRKDGHGFGLHSSALAVKEMGGLLTVHSDGPGQGATFTLELPLPDAGELK